MNPQATLATLVKPGNPQTAAIDKRHGAGDHVYGVLTSEIGKLQKRIKTDHALAMALWRTRNAEARLLALRIADPKKVTRDDVDRPGLIRGAAVRCHRNDGRRAPSGTPGRRACHRVCRP